MPSSGPHSGRTAGPPAGSGEDALLLTPVQVAEVLGLGRSKIYDLMGQGRLPFVLIDTARRVPRACVEEFIQNELRRQGFIV